MRVIMTKSMPGSEDGIHITRYEAGEEYDMGEALAQAFIKSKCARPLPEPKPHPEGGNGNKGGKGPDENKAA